ncbi:hypothetical protein CELL_03110 [Cellulomonas sp. T2.31MG-18]|uniref:DUF4192 domain-containing protein n=1 Tax=Cellulomonas sp. T2.31MG-18 TaxID=3157619 RepID=UPI0035E9D376
MSLSTLRVSEPRELLALIPHQLGFRPAHSAVAISLRPPRGQVGLVIRVDLADLAERADGPRLARALVSHLDRDGADRCVLVLYTGTDPRSGSEPAVAPAVEHFREAAAAPFGEVPVWVVTDRGYLALDCADPCCPVGGRPLAELDATQVGAQMVLAGSAVAGSRDDVARIRSAGAEARKAVARVRRRWVARRAAATSDAALERWRLDSVGAWRRAVAEAGDSTVRIGGSALGRLEAGLVDPRVRDAVLVALVPGTGSLPERSVTGARTSAEADAGLADALALVVDPSLGVRPPSGATRIHERALERVVAHGERGHQEPALTLLALLAWWRGDGARAQLLLARAFESDPAYRLAHLIDDAVAQGVPPGWVRAEA